ncbi:hypothetical protein [Xanthomonas arboricola]|uniref:hypothetical protein n=1 Tax=Xanthomonas arboricola TaxID=56448 RepID=UPI001290385A|nr:hypothetical protein [Xanthomonas arboricola]
MKLARINGRNSKDMAAAAPAKQARKLADAALHHQQLAGGAEQIDRPRLRHAACTSLLTGSGWR